MGSFGARPREAHSQAVLSSVLAALIAVKSGVTATRLHRLTVVRHMTATPLALMLELEEKSTQSSQWQRHSDLRCISPLHGKL
jgi:hypothetical protein